MERHTPLETGIKERIQKLEKLSNNDIDVITITKDERRDLRRELMKDDMIKKYKREVDNLHKAVKRLQNINNKLIIENNKLKTK